MPKIKGAPFKTEHIKCECGGFYSDKNNYFQHIKTKKHQHFTETGNVYIAKSYTPEYKISYQHNYYINVRKDRLKSESSIRKEQNSDLNKIQDSPTMNF